jgi:hypothetical protein
MFKSAEALPDMKIMGEKRTKEVPPPRDKKTDCSLKK